MVFEAEKGDGDVIATTTSHILEIVELAESKLISAFVFAM